MKKLIYSFFVVFLATTSFAQNEEIHDAKIIGSFEFENKEVTTIYDEVTGCELKTSPHSKNLFTPDESVQIKISSNKQMAEVYKHALNEQVYANKNCGNELVELRPYSYSEIADFYGLHHNKILDFCITESPIKNKDEYVGKYNQLYKGTSFQEFGNVNLMDKFLEKTSSVNIMIESLMESKNQIIQNTIISEAERNASLSIIDLTILFLEDDDIDKFYSELNNLKTSIETSKIDETLTNPNQEMVKTLCLIGVAQHSSVFWLAKSNNNDIQNPDEPQALAPWVAADIIGGVVGVYGNIFTDVVSGSTSSWSTYGASFLWGAATTSLGGWFKW